MSDLEEKRALKKELKELYDERSSLAEIVLEFLEEDTKSYFIKSAITKRNQLDDEIDKINKKLYYGG